MTSCTEYQIRIQLFVDGELSPSEAEELQRHIETCVDCEHSLVEVKNFSERIRAARIDTQAPERLRQRLQRDIATEQRRVPFEPGPMARMSPWRNGMGVATAAMLLIGIGSAVLFYHRSQDRSSDMMHTAVTAHQELQQNQIPLDIHTDSSQEVSQWFSKRVSFPFHMADAGIASDDRAKYKLAGGRLMSVHGEHVALLSFRMGDEAVVLLVGSGQFDVDSGGTVIESDGIALHSRDEGAIHIVSWKNRGLSYVLVSRTPMANTGKCGRCHEAADSVHSNTVWMRQNPLKPIDQGGSVQVANSDVPIENLPSPADR